MTVVQGNTDDPGFEVDQSAAEADRQNRAGEVADRSAHLKAAESAQAGIICASATSQGRDYLPRVAALREPGQRRHDRCCAGRQLRPQDITDEIVLRAAMARVMARPDYTDVAPRVLLVR